MNGVNGTFITVERQGLVDSPRRTHGEEHRREGLDFVRDHAPSIVFFDEICAIAYGRNTLHWYYDANLNDTLLAGLDGLNDLEEVCPFAATNRIDALNLVHLIRYCRRRMATIRSPPPYINNEIRAPGTRPIVWS